MCSRLLTREVVAEQRRGSAPSEGRMGGGWASFLDPILTLALPLWGREQAVLFWLMLLFIAALGLARAADYPARPVQVIVPFAAGGSADMRVRQIAEPLAARLGRPVLVLNKPGASGSIGMRALVRSAPDGYTLGFINSAIAGIAPNLMRDPGYDPLEDLAPITRVALAQAVLVVRPDFPARTLQELLAAARARPGTVTYASGGVGSINHL